MSSFGFIVIEVWKTQFPVWGFVLALAICEHILLRIFYSWDVESFSSSFHPLHTDRDDSSDYKPTNRPKCDHRVDFGLRVTRSTTSNDAVQDLWL